MGLKEKNKVWFGKHYELTDEDKECITKAFNKGDLEDLLGFCEALAMCASFQTWADARKYLEEVGYDRFFSDCGNCGNAFTCEPEFDLNVCGKTFKEWKPMTSEQEIHLKALRANLKED